MEKDGRELHYTWEHQMHAISTTRKSNQMLEDQDKQKILILDIVRTNEGNKTEKRADEIQKYQQLSYELQERSSGFTVKVVTMKIRCLWD